MSPTHDTPLTSASASGGNPGAEIGTTESAFEEASA
jgi:hypothetical protein